MKTSLFTAFCLLLSLSSKADIIKCEFTEPFLITTYSMAQQTLSYVYAGTEKGDPVNQVIKNVSFQIKAAGVFELVGQDGVVIQTLTLNYKGSDGMSETIFPFEVKEAAGYGGCISNHLKSKEGEQP